MTVAFSFFYNFVILYNFENIVNKNRMIARAFRDVWLFVMFFKFSNWGSCNFDNLTIYHEIFYTYRTGGHIASCRVVLRCI